MHAPIDIIADLEAQVGDLIVTRALAASMATCWWRTLTSPRPLRISAGMWAMWRKRPATCWPRSAPRSSDDGKLDAREAQACLPEVREAQAALAQLTHDLERVADSPPMVPRRAPG